MSRIVFALVALVTFTPLASAQFSAGSMSAPVGIPPYAAIPPGQQGDTILFPVIMPWGWAIGWAYRTYDPLVGYRYVYGGVLTSMPVAPEPVPAKPERPKLTFVLSEEFPAKLSLQFPAAAEVWLDGKKVSSKPSVDQELSSPILRADLTYTFNVKARWSKDGKTYEAKRKVTVKPGEHSRLLVVSGDEVSEQGKSSKQ